MVSKVEKAEELGECVINGWQRIVGPFYGGIQSLQVHTYRELAKATYRGAAPPFDACAPPPLQFLCALVRSLCALLQMPPARPNPKRLAFFFAFSGLFLEKSPFRLFRNFLQIFALFRPLDCDFILCPLLTLNFVLFTSSEQSDSLNRVTFSLIFERIEWTCSCPHLETLIFCLEKCKEHFWLFLDFFFQGNSGILPFKKRRRAFFSLSRQNFRLFWSFYEKGEKHFSGKKRACLG